MLLTYHATDPLNYVAREASKIKAFSKEGLVQQAKVDPYGQAKADAANFLSKVNSQKTLPLPG